MVQLTQEDKAFLKENKHFLEKNDLNSFVDAMRGVGHSLNVIQFLLDKGINVISYFKNEIPGIAFIDTDIEKITIPNGITRIGRSAFAACKSLKEVQLPASLKVIEAFAFGGCKSLEKIEIPEGVEEISGLAFNACSSLKEVYLPSTIRKMGDGVFYECPKDLKIYCPFNPEEISWKNWQEYKKNIVRV